MAKHAKRKKRPATRRRRRIGATAALNPSSPLVQYGSIALGFFMGPKINEAIDKAVGTNIDSKIIAGGQIGLGALLSFKKGKKNLLTTVAGGVLLGAGAKRGLTAFGLGRVGGYQMVPAVGGYQSVPAIGARRVGGYVPGPGGINGYKVSKETVGSTGLRNAGSNLMQS
jgi:hypothetical protein